MIEFELKVPFFSNYITIVHVGKLGNAFYSFQIRAIFILLSTTRYFAIFCPTKVQSSRQYSEARDAI